MVAKRHLITGAGSGIGAALADLLHARGDDVVLLARSEERSEELAARYPGAGTLVVNLRDVLAVEATVVPGELDSVVHCAGVVALDRVADLAIDDLRDQIATNLVAPVLLTRNALPALRARGGTAVFVNSTAGLVTNAGWSAYGASKAGLRAVADALRAEEADHGVRVTSVFPSRTATAMQESVRTQEGQVYDPNAYMSAASVAASIAHVLDLPGDVTVPELVLRTAPATR